MRLIRTDFDVGVLLCSATLSIGTSTLASGKYIAALRRAMVGHHLHLRRNPLAAGKVARDVDHLHVPETKRFEVSRVDEDDPTTAVHAAVAIVRPVDRRIELIVTPHGGEQQFARLEFVGRNRLGNEFRSARIGLESATARRVREREDVRLDAAIEVLETRDHVGNVIPNRVVVSCERVPLHR